MSDKNELPVAWMDADGCLHTTLESAAFSGRPVTPLFTHPAPAVEDADMFWDSDNPEESFSTDPHDLADSIAALGYPDEEPFEAVVDCAKRFPSRRMKIWSEKDEDGDYYTKWEWVK